MHGPNYPKLTPDLINQEKEYKVEAIIMHRKYGRWNQYLIKWKGYPTSDNSWEPEWNLKCTGRLLASFKHWKHLWSNGTHLFIPPPFLGPYLCHIHHFTLPPHLPSTWSKQIKRENSNLRRRSKCMQHHYPSFPSYPFYSTTLSPTVLYIPFTWNSSSYSSRLHEDATWSSAASLSSNQWRQTSFSKLQNSLNSFQTLIVSGQTIHAKHVSKKCQLIKRRNENNDSLSTNCSGCSTLKTSSSLTIIDMLTKSLLPSTPTNTIKPLVFTKDAAYWNNFLSKVDVGELMWKLELNFNDPVNVLLRSYTDLKDQLELIQQNLKDTMLAQVQGILCVGGACHLLRAKRQKLLVNHHLSTSPTNKDNSTDTSLIVLLNPLPVIHLISRPYFPSKKATSMFLSY